MREALFKSGKHYVQQLVKVFKDGKNNGKILNVAELFWEFDSWKKIPTNLSVAKVHVQ